MLCLNADGGVEARVCLCICNSKFRYCCVHAKFSLNHFMTLVLHIYKPCPANTAKVSDTRPLALQNMELLDPSSVEKYTMPESKYEGLSDSVLAWKKTNKLGRFDPAAPEHVKQKIDLLWEEVREKGITVGQRCQLGDDSSRRGVVRFVGVVKEIPGTGGPWVGIELDEPVGRNNGSVGGVPYFQCMDKHGVFVRAERVIIGDFKPLLDDDEAMEEI